ncbi:MAG TPA: two-component regulator propeller domain-containing protein, partial [Chitinophagaceae bacterium]|nr:two-component regulator propeller domain-containing protein [Chitinophagaceae bacterium]
MATLPARGQTLSFTHLNTSNGLSGNSVQCLGIDSSGFLWIGTSDGLNSYNGYDITTYYRDQYPGMQSDTIQHLFCDSRNRVWLLHGSAMSMLDEQKKFHPIVLPAGTINNPVTFRSAYETTEYGVVINTTNGIYQYDEKSRGLKEIGWLSEKTGINNYFSTAPLTKDIVVYFLNPHLFIADHRSKKVILEKEIAGIVGACRVDDQHFATITRNGGISIIDRSTGNVQKQFHIYNEVDGVRSTPKVFEMTCTPNGQLAISTGFAGLAMVDIASGAITYFRHDPLDPASISTDILYRVLAGKNGEIITGATNTGVNISNINNQRATYKKIFRDASGNVFDGHSNDMVEDRNGNIWLAGIDRLICWDRKTNRAKFYPYSFNDGINGPRNIEIRTLCIDHKDRIWVGAIGAGVALFDQSTGKFKLISDTAVGGALSDTYINDIMESSDGLIWACSYRGVYTINTSDFKITRYDQHPVLKAVADKVVISLYEDAQQRIWIGTQRQGIFCYDKKNNNIRNI